MSRYVIQAGWDDVPHLSEADKTDMLASIPPFQRDARSKGKPQLGAGAIYPVPESSITVPDFIPPRWWPRCGGLDVGWNWTAFAFWCRDPETGIAYCYHARKLGNMEPSEVVRHVNAVETAGRIRIAIDPAANGRGQSDGQTLFAKYRDLGLDLVNAENSVESGLYECWQRFVSGRSKLMSGACQQMLAEYRVYQRDEKGRVVKGNDHLMDGGLRYPTTTFMAGPAAWTILAPEPQRVDEAAMWAAARRARRDPGDSSPDRHREAAA